MNSIYLDNSATTKPSEASLKKMGEALSVAFGNPSSVHGAGNRAKSMVEAARLQVARALGARRQGDCRIVFTSGGTEANNLALFGTVYAKNRPEKGGSRGKIFISSGEHSSVEASAKRLEADGFTVLRVPAPGGELDLDFVRENSGADVIMASLMLVNNETGALYNVKAAADIIKAASPRAVIHCDAVQGFLKTKFTPASISADAVSVSAHKIFAPKGAGALYLTNDMIKTKRIVPTMCGGGQEEGFRSGTENVPAIAAFGAAAEEGAREFDARYARLCSLREHLFSLLSDCGVKINEPKEAVPGIINITLPGIRSEIMLNYLSGEGICVSAGSACSTHSKGPSRALLAFGLTREEADCSVRISLSHENTEEELSIFAACLTRGINILARK